MKATKSRPAHGLCLPKWDRTAAARGRRTELASANMAAVAASIERYQAELQDRG